MSKDQKSILIITAGFILLGLLAGEYSIYYYVITVIATITCLSIKWVRDIILSVWNGIGKVLGWINSRIILSIIFYLILTPIATLKRMFSKKKSTNESYYFNRNHKYTKADLENPW